MKQPFVISPHDMPNLSPASIREHFLIETVFIPGCIALTNTIDDQLLVGGAMPTGVPLPLPVGERTNADYFLERRELGVLNVGGTGCVVVDGQRWELDKQDCLYVSRGSRAVTFESLDATNPAKFYLLSTPAHRDYPTARRTLAEAIPVEVSTHEKLDACTIYQYIFQEGIQSCQLLMGLTQLKPDSIWNSEPSPSPGLRTAAYLYFSLEQGQRVLHLLGEPKKTRPQWVSNGQAILLPPWSIRMSGGPQAYTFVWGMAREQPNQEAAGLT